MKLFHHFIYCVLGLKEEAIKLGEQNTDDPTSWKFLQIIVDSQKTDIQYYDGLVTILVPNVDLLTLYSKDRVGWLFLLIILYVKCCLYIQLVETLLLNIGEGHYYKVGQGQHNTW